MNDMENLRTFADQLWKYMVPKLDSKFASNVSYFRAEVVSNPGNNMLEVQRPVENGTLTLPCTTAMSGATAGQQVTVLVMGNLSNAVVVADGKMDVSKFLYITAGQRDGVSMGAGATAEGTNNVASGTDSHAEGRLTNASGDYSHSSGLGTSAHGNAQFVFGKYNVVDDNDTYVEIVGRGTGGLGTQRRNARTLDWSGNEWIAGTLTQASDARLKDVQGEIPDLSSIRAVRFRWKNGDDKEHLGYLAQDVEEIAPYLVGVDSNGYKSLDYIALLTAKVEMLEQEIEKLKQ